MRRTRLRTAFLIVVGAALGGIGYLVSHNVVAHRAHPLEELGRDFLPRSRSASRIFVGSRWSAAG